MKILSSFVFVVIFQLGTFAQTSNMFHIREILVTDTLKRKKPTDFKPENPNFFEDENYIVRKTCSGEWGGTIWFKSKKTGIEHSCIATCAVVINKMDGKYIVTTTLAHMVGSSRVIEIDNPDSMDVFKFPLRKDKSGNRIMGTWGDDESQTTKGSKVLVDTLQIMTMASFPYKKRLFYVITDRGKTYIAEIVNKRFVITDKLSDKDIWTYDPEVLKTKDKHYIVFFTNEKADGYLDIYKNNITLTRYR